MHAKPSTPISGRSESAGSLLLIYIQITWLRGELEKSELLTASARPRAQRRLNRAEYNRTVSDLFGLPLRPADGFPPDDMLHGFNNVAEGLNTSVVLLDRYLDAAQSVAARVLRPAPEQPPAVTTFATMANRPGGKEVPNFRLFDPNSFLLFGGTNDGAWDRRHWVGHAWGTDIPIRHPGSYKVSVSGRPRHFAAGERAIVRMEIDERVAGVFDSPPANGGNDLLFETTVGIEKSSGTVPFVFTFVNGNPFGGAVGETVDYYPSSWQRHHDAKQKHFREHIGKSGDSWMPHELEGLDIRWIEDVRLEISGPHYDAWPPVGFQREFAAELKARDLRAVIAGFLPKAFRRPVTEAEVANITKFAETGAGADAKFADKLQAALTRILVAPEFLFLVETVPPGKMRGGYRLTNWELAARLSYFLTGTTPDAELRAVAARGDLTDAAKLDAQVQRLLRDPRCVTALTDGFLNSWLHLDRLAGVMPEPKLFPHFGDDLKRSMAEEPKAFFAALLRENGKVTDLLDANYTWANERLAMHYGLDRASIRGSELRRVNLPNRQRGGLLGMAGLLTLTSEATRTSPVKRGIYVLENIFNRPPPPPPPSVGDLIPNTVSAKSIREHLALHREDTACAGCHNRIDPWGLALENFDAVGAWRTNEVAWEDPSRPQKRKERERAPTFAINASFELPIMSDAAKRFTGLDAARAELLHRRDDFARGFTEKMMTYALGRGLVISDYQRIEAATAALTRALNKQGSACGHVSENGASSFLNKYALHKSNSAGQSPEVRADSPAEVLDRSWQCFAMTFDHQRDELTGWLNGVSGDRWLDNPKNDKLISSAYNAYLQGHFARTPDQEPAEDATFPKDQYYNPPEGEPVSVKVLRESGDERVELREHRQTKIEVTLRDGKEVARDLVGLRLNPWWYPHDLYTPKDAQSGGPFTIGRVIHSSRGVGFTGWIGGVAVFDRALSVEELGRLTGIAKVGRER